MQAYNVYKGEAPLNMKAYNVFRGEYPFTEQIDIVYAESPVVALQEAINNVKKNARANTDVYMKHPVIEPFEGEMQ